MWCFLIGFQHLPKQNAEKEEEEEREEEGRGGGGGGGGGGGDESMPGLCEVQRRQRTSWQARCWLEITWICCRICHQKSPCPIPFPLETTCKTPGRYHRHLDSALTSSNLTIAVLHWQFAFKFCTSAPTPPSRFGLSLVCPNLLSDQRRPVTQMLPCARSSMIGTSHAAQPWCATQRLDGTFDAELVSSLQTRNCSHWYVTFYLSVCITGSQARKKKYALPLWKPSFFFFGV